MSRTIRWSGSALLVLAVFGAIAWNRIDLAPQALLAGPPAAGVVEAAREGSSAQKYELALSLLGSERIARDVPQAAYWFGQAAAHGDARSQSALGHMLIAGRGIEAGASDATGIQRWVELPEAKADAGADDISASPAEAMTWLEKAAVQGETDAQLRLALALEHGEAAEPDLAQAVRWYRKAARAGDVTAQFNVARLYDGESLGVRDGAEAATWFRLAAEQGHARSQARLSELYTIGDGVHPRYDEAARWAKASAEQGDAEGCYAYAVLHLKGFGVEQDFAAAIHWYREAALGGHSAAQNMLGTVYLAGEGVEQNLAEAERWWRMAADQGYAPSQFNLGGMFSRELSVSLSREEAMEWLSAAAAQGHRRAALEWTELDTVAQLDDTVSATAYDATF